MIRFLFVISLSLAGTPPGQYPSFFDMEPIEGNEDTYVDDDDWDEPYSDAGRNYNPAAYFPSDPCTRLCEEFSASHRGNGFDLCEDDRTSICIYDTNSRLEICSNLLWDRTDDNQPGIVFEEIEEGGNDPDLRSVTCYEAEEIVFGNPAEPLLHVATRMPATILTNSSYDISHWYSAIHIFTHLPHVEQAMSGMTPSPLLQMLQNFTTNVMNTLREDGFYSVAPIDEIRQYVGAIQLSRGDMLLSVFDQLVLGSGRMIEVFMSDFVEDSACENCGAEFHDAFLGPIRLPNTNETISIQEILDSRFLVPGVGATDLCPFCGFPTTLSGRRMGQVGRYLMLSFTEPQHVLMSTRLDADGIEYELVAISHRFPDMHYEADILINHEWFRATNQTITPTTIVDFVELTTVSTVFYSRLY